nr:MAG TPA: hypothetical protein [Caudoviricetes sp.]
MIAQTPYQNMIYSQPQMAYTPQMYNPWTTRPQSQVQPMPIEQPQQVMQPQVKPLTGKVVQTLEAITANDVPMDGTAAFFPKQDLSEIYVKGWNAEGQIETIVYKPVRDTKPTQEVNNTFDAEKFKIDLSESVTEGITARLDNLYSKIEEIESKLTSSQRKNSRSQSKGGDEE